jgi:hypothetical protein
MHLPSLLLSVMATETRTHARTHARTHTHTHTQNILWVTWIEFYPVNICFILICCETKLQIKFPKTKAIWFSWQVWNSDFLWAANLRLDLASSVKKLNSCDSSLQTSRNIDTWETGLLKYNCEGVGIDFWVIVTGWREGDWGQLCENRTNLHRVSILWRPCQLSRKRVQGSWGKFFYSHSRSRRSEPRA